MNEGINVLSLFDGMSCGRIALDRIGIKVNKYYASEIDKYAMKMNQLIIVFLYKFIFEKIWVLGFPEQELGATQHSMMSM